MNLIDLWAPSMQRTKLRRAALRYAEHGWRIVPGAALLGDRYTCGPLCSTVDCHPAMDSWECRASSNIDDVFGWWMDLPHSVLIATGHHFDAIEVPERIGAAATVSVSKHSAGTHNAGGAPITHRAGTTRLAAARTKSVGPVTVGPTGQRTFLVKPGAQLSSELTSRHDVVVHAAGSWIPAPPTRTPGGRVRWAVHPAATDWQLADAQSVQRLLIARLRPSSAPMTFASTTRSMGTAA